LARERNDAGTSKNEKQEVQGSRNYLQDENRKHLHPEKWGVANALQGAPHKMEGVGEFIVKSGEAPNK